MPLQVNPLQADLSFGVRVGGVTAGLLGEPDVRREINRLFEAHGMIVFEDVEPTGAMQVALSEVFGPLKDHPSPAVPRVEGGLPGVIEMRQAPDDDGLVEVDGERLTHWLPWHFDHCYNDQLNRAGVLRATEIASDGGLTGFVDGIDLYNDLSPDLRDQIEGANIVYRMNVILGDMRFGRPKSLNEIAVKQACHAVMEHARGTPRAWHPAVWTRATGEKVLHVSPWMAEGIQGRENAEGDALLEAVCQAMIASARPYYHRWRPTDMLIWDNWRMLHAVTGMPPHCTRAMQRTTIRGDYGLGGFEQGGVAHPVLQLTV